MLRLLDIGDPDASQTSRLKYQQIFLPVMVPSVGSDGIAKFRTVDPRIPYQTILRDKPAEGFRVFIFGGSATAGLGYSPNVTFARHLERMLRDAYRNHVIEIVNLGIVALSSRQVSLLVKDVVANFSPDLVIVYSGNNEFLEIHAEKYARVHATTLSHLLDMVAETNLSRALNRVLHGGGQSPSLAEMDLSHEGLRATQNQIIQDIQMSDEEVTEVINVYKSNIRDAVTTAKQHAVPILLISVASNWEWRGRSDLPAGWLAELTGTGAAATYAQAVTMLDDKLKNVSDQERHEVLFKRATVHKMMGNYGAARDDFRAAMNVDPHLRRALDTANMRLRTIAETNGVAFLDMVEELSARNKRKIVGFEQFYDYVHFTPKGAIWAAAAIFETLQEQGIVPVAPQFDSEQCVRDRVTELEQLKSDFLDVYQWLGIGFDLDRIQNRDLWKYDKMLLELEQLVEKDPDNFRALVYLGNALFFKPDRAEDAILAYRSALKVEDNAEVRKNCYSSLSAPKGNDDTTGYLSVSGRVTRGSVPSRRTRRSRQRPAT